MSKYYPSVRRLDSLTDHVHALPNGKMTLGSLMKPAKDRFGWHTHLYEMNGRTYETMPAHMEGDHTHETELGETSGQISALSVKSA